MEMEESSLSLKDYIQIAKRQKYYIIIPTLILLSISVLIALILPPVYRSQSTILIERQHIPVDLVKSTVVSFADERIQQIQQKIMRIDNINKIISKFNLYSDKAGKLSPTEMAETFSENVVLDVISADVISEGRKSKATLAFNLSFDDRSPVLAQKVANELVTSFLSENARSRTQRAKETSGFLKEESNKYKQEIQIIESKLAEYKDKYSQSLPELLPVSLSSITRIENDLQQLRLQLKMLGERKSSLRSQLAMTNVVLSVPGKNRQTAPISLPGLKAEYSRLLSRYSESHPDVKAIKRKISNFKKTDNTSTNLQGSGNNPIYFQLTSELQLANVEIGNIKKLQKELVNSLKKLELNVSQTHQVERGYNDLLRDLQGHQSKYDDLKAKYMDAKIAQTLEEEQKAEKFSILEPPRIPRNPDKPDRLKILFIGFILSLCGGLGFGYLIEIMRGGIRGQRALYKVTGVEPLVVIPYIVTEEDITEAHRNKINFFILGGLIFIGMVVAVHILYMNLDVLWFRLLHKLELVALS
ncbi:MAG: hypothetical protein KAH20_11260 [Methylococcales bacterium]|nr:hypothetical protein [Methylococcales bacterium]